MMSLFLKTNLTIPMVLFNRSIHKKKHIGFQPYLLPTAAPPSPFPSSSTRLDQELHQGGGPITNELLKVYSRRPTAPQTARTLEPEVSPDSTNEGTKSSGNPDLPIAVRKRVRKCTQYPLSTHLTYAKLSHEYKVLLQKWTV